MRKTMGTLFLTAAITAAMATTAFAAGWQQDTIGYWWQNDDGSYPVSTWQWLDGNNDGIAESYYFDANGYMAANTVVDGYTVNADGAWVENGVVQTQNVETASAPAVDPMSRTKAAAGTVDYGKLNGTYTKDDAMGEGILFSHTNPDSITISNASASSMEVSFEGGSHPSNGTCTSEDGVTYLLTEDVFGVEDRAYFVILESGKICFERSVPYVGSHYAFYKK